MAVSSAYKDYQREPRQITVEDLFNLGMSYADTPLQEGYAKLLVNFNLKDQGTSLVPRGGIKEVTADLASAHFPKELMGDSTKYCVHHVGSTLVMTADGQDATVHKYILVAKVVYPVLTEKMYYSLNDAYVIVDVDGAYTYAQLTTPYLSAVKDRVLDAHGTNIPKHSSTCEEGMFCSISANTYIPVVENSGVGCFTQLVLAFNEAGALTAQLKKLEPKEVPAAQVINSGYNMMKADPYLFSNTQNATGAVVLGGVIPKTIAGVLKLTNDVGETIRYHLNYSYPIADTNKKYMVQWEVVDATTGTIAQVLQQVRKSTQYAPGDDIYLDYTVGYKQYTLVVKLYYADVVTAHAYVSDEDDYNNIIPEKVITISSYTSNNSSKNTANLTAKNYDLSTCASLCVWQQRMVVWGVKDAPSTLFISQPNLPEYVAYPNNVEVFNEDIVTCVPYLDYLLVFTTDKLYKLAFATDGISVYYTTKCVQANLPMNKYDANTIQIVKNMVYFKSNNYFYMVVPNVSAGVGELQLAPISNPINRLLDNFKTNVDSIINETYNLDKLFRLDAETDHVEITIVDYANHIAGATIHNVYKCLVNPSWEAEHRTEAYYIDFILNYDTLSRAWTVYLYESTMYRMLPYEQSITNGARYIHPVYHSEGYYALSVIQFDDTSPKDEAAVKAGVTRKFDNYQLLNTGYRSHYSQHKKRFREIQFSVYNAQQSPLTFYTGFTVDDDIRKDLYTHTVQHNTDPNDLDYGLVYVETELAEPEVIAGALGANESSWVLDFTKFPTLTVSKVRYKISGKGYNGKIKILSTNTALYEILNTNWVYRKMNAR